MPRVSRYDDQRFRKRPQRQPVDQLIDPRALRLLAWQELFLRDDQEQGR